jgi:hypothetical protein
MSDSKTWENECCRCGNEVQVILFPGKRACHVTCGPCQYPEDWSKCAACEIVGHCMYALAYLKALRPNGIRKGCYFEGQLTGEETLYHTLAFVDAQSHMLKATGDKKYLDELRKANERSPCLRK